MKRTEPDSFDKILAECLTADEQDKNAVQRILEQHPEHAQELQDLLALTHALGDLRATSHLPVILAHKRRWLVGKLPDRQVSFWQRLSQRWQKGVPVLQRRFSILVQAMVLMLALIVLTSGVLYAASEVKPGGKLYGVVLKLEEVEIFLASDDESAAGIYVKHSTRRLNEVQQLMEDGDIDSALVALNAFEQEISKLDELIKQPSEVEQQQAVLEFVEDARSRHLDVLVALLAKVPESAHAAIEHAIQVSQPDSHPLADPSDTPGIANPESDASAGQGQSSHEPKPPAHKDKQPSNKPPKEVGPPVNLGRPENLPVPKTLPPPAQGNPGGKP